MTIASLINRNDYIGSDSTDTFSYTFKIFVDTDLLVTQRDDTDVETTLVLNTDFTVTGAGETAGGSVVLTGGNLATNYALTLRRVRPLTQTTDLRNLGDSFPQTLEDTYDQEIMIAQQQSNDISRSIQLPETTTNFDVVLPEPVALSWWRVNAAGTGIEWITAADISAVATTVDASLTLSSGELRVTNPNLFAVGGGTVDVITASVSPAPASLTNNLRVYFEASGANTVVAPTFNLDGLGAKDIVKGSNFALRAGDIPGANARVDLVFDASLDKWVYLNPALMEDAAATADVQSGSYLYGVGAGAVNVMTTTLTPTLLAYTVGMEITVKVNLANTSTTPTLNVDALGAKTIVHKDGTALAIGDLPINHYAEFKYDGTNMVFQNPVEQIVGISGKSRNLVIIPNSGTPLTQIDVDADEIILGDSSGRTKWVGSANHTIDATGNGLNGLDTGSLTTNSWYYVFEITDGITEGALLSLSSTAPTMPANYTFKALLGAVKTDGSSQFRPFKQVDKRMDYDVAQTIKSASFTAGSWQSLDVSAFFPPIAKNCRYMLGQGASGSDLGCGISPRSDGNAGVFGSARVSLASPTFSVLSVGSYSAIFAEIRYEATSYYWWAGTTGCIEAMGCDL